MEERKKENATNNDLNLQADSLIDLLVVDEMADEVSGGTVTFPSKGGGMWIMTNHNETVAEDAEVSDTAIVPLTDLPVTAEQTQQTKGGSSRDHDKWIDVTPISQIVTRPGSNHNETVAEDAEDSAIAMAPLTDLPVAVEQAEEVSGGAIGMKCQNNLKQIGLAIA